MAITEREKSLITMGPDDPYRAGIEGIPGAEKHSLVPFRVLSTHGRAMLRHRRLAEIAEEVEVCVFGREDGSHHAYGFRLGDRWHMIAMTGLRPRPEAAERIAREGWEDASRGSMTCGYYLTPIPGA